MAGLIPQSFIDDLLNRTDIVDVVSSRVQLKKPAKTTPPAARSIKKTPSFSVSPDKQFYYCFGCGAGGNALGFLMDHDNLDFPRLSRTWRKPPAWKCPAKKVVARTNPGNPPIRRCTRY